MTVTIELNRNEVWDAIVQYAQRRLEGRFEPLTVKVDGNGGLRLEKVEVGFQEAPQ